MATNKQELLDEIRNGPLYKMYYKPNDTIPRDDIKQEVNPTGEANERLVDLQRRIKVATMRETDWPQELRKDANNIRALIQSAIVRLYADSPDGTISNSDFQEYFKPLAGMTEGLIAALSVDDPSRMMTLRSMKSECYQKPFWRQLRKVVVESSRGTVDRTRFFQLAKAVNSFNTHLFIGAEQGGHLPTGLVEEVGEVVSSLNEKAKRGVWDYSRELDKVRAWGLVEEDRKTDVSAPGQPTGDDRWSGDKDGQGKKVDVTPPQLLRAPGNPPDEKEGETDLSQDEGKMEKGLPSKIDGKPAEPKKEEVEFLVRTPQKRGFMEWNIYCGSKTVGEAWRHTFLGGSRFHAEINSAELSKMLNEARDIPGDGVRLEASDIYTLQTRVIESLNRIASQLKQSRRFILSLN